MKRSVPVVVIVAYLLAAPAVSQDRFEQLPGHEQYREVRSAMGAMAMAGRVSRIEWLADGTGLTFHRDGKNWTYTFETGAVTEGIEADEADDEEGESRPRRGRPARGRQSAEAESPDGAWTAICRDHNLVLRNNETQEEVAVTTDGHRKFKYATASWVYGEELDQNSAMWWSHDSARVAFYEFDEREVIDFYLTPNLTEVQNELEVEGYPKPGAKNPVASLLVYDVASRRTVRIETGDETEQYVYNVRFSPNGSELLFNRTNRRQSVLDVMAADPATGAARSILRETQDTWQKNSPIMRFLADGRRFIWETERSGWQHWELRSLDSDEVITLTHGDYPCDSLLAVDEDGGWIYYTAFSAELPLDTQLHRARLDGSRQERITKDEINHTRIELAPDFARFVATTEGIETPASTHVFDMTGARLATLAEPDMSKFDELGLEMPELFTFKAADGVTDLYGQLFKPSDFDPTKSYPLLIDVYGGPLSQGVRNTWRAANPYCEFGLLIAKIDNRGTVNRGKAFEGATYLKLGIVDIQDQADGVRFLSTRPYVDGSRVGITGHSYGGYMAALAILKFPDVFHVSVAGAAVTDWRNYDTIYTERYMWIPQENEAGYTDGSCLTHAENLKGRLLLLHGMVDDNVHPTNLWQLAHKLQQAKKPFEMMCFPTSGHGIGSPSVNPLKWEFLVEHLVDPFAEPIRVTSDVTPAG